MIGRLQTNSIMRVLAAIVLTAAFACHDASAQVKPFKISGAGIIDYVPLVAGEMAGHWAVGTATHLGKCYGEGKAVIESVDLQNFTGEFSSAVPFVFTAANGDDLAFHYGRTDFGAESVGEVTLYPSDELGKVIAVWVAEFNPVPEQCTGRFEKVIGGSFIMTAVTEPFVPFSNDSVAYEWNGDGSIEFKKGRKKGRK